MKKALLIVFYSFSTLLYAQDISLYQQFNGNVDFTMIGNTLNTSENEALNDCSILTSSSAILNLNNTDYVEAAYLYWAGSGTGDFQISLNGIDLTAERTFATNYFSYNFFSAFFDVTNQVRATGNGVYTLSNLDLTDIISAYCANGTNFGGWAIIIVYSNDYLPINQINVYDGMQRVPNSITIELDNLNVIDNTDAKIGFLAWEGDSALAINETLTINNNPIGNPPLNPFNNAFNGTNSFTGESNLYNMDLDVYSIENNINIGDTSATIRLTSGQDYVMINSVVTKLNSQLPDATIQLDNYLINDCNNRSFRLDFRVFNLPEATSKLPNNTPISFYAFDGNDYLFLGNHYTLNEIEIGAYENQTHFFTLPNSVPNNFTLFAYVDQDSNGNSTVIELNENNNEDFIEINIPEIPTIKQPEPITACNTGFDKAFFDLESTINTITNNSSLEVSFYENEEDLNNFENEITNLNQYENSTNPQLIYIKVINLITGCYATTTLILNVENCPPIIPQLLPINTLLDTDSLYNIYPNFEITIFNRYGNIIYEGNNTSDKFNGYYKGQKLPTATYFYVILLNDEYQNVINGWIYVM